MDHYLTGMQVILGAFALVLIAIFAVAAVLDNHFRETWLDRGLHSGREYSVTPRNTGSNEGGESVFEESPTVLNAEGIGIAAE